MAQAKTETKPKEPIKTDLDRILESIEGLKKHVTTEMDRVKGKLNRINGGDPWG